MTEENKNNGSEIIPYQGEAGKKAEEPKFEITDLHRKLYDGCKTQFSEATQASLYQDGTRADIAGMKFILDYKRKNPEKHFSTTERKRVVSDYLKEMLIGYDVKNQGRLDAYRKSLEARNLDPADIEEKMLNNMMGHAEHYLGIDGRQVMKVVNSMEEGGITKSLQQLRMHFLREDGFVKHKNETYWAKCAADDDFLYAVPKMLMGDSDFTKNFKADPDMIFGTMHQREALEQMVAAEANRQSMMNGAGFAPISQTLDKKLE